MNMLILDTETGGLDAYNSDILQLSCQIMDYGTQRTIKSVDKFFPWPEDKSRVSLGCNPGEWINRGVLVH
jgi:DNA polymerase III alpha subunit (gram-positive type)